MKLSKLMVWVVVALLMLAVAPAALAQGGFDPCGSNDPCDQGNGFFGNNNGFDPCGNNDRCDRGNGFFTNNNGIDPCGNNDPCDQGNGLCGINNGPFNNCSGINNGFCGNGSLGDLFLDLFGNCGLFG